MKYSIVTFGCRVNQADSLAIEARLRRRGALDARPEEADVVVVNSCSVTAAADQGVRQTIRRIVRGNPDVKVVVTGCYATRRPDEIAALPNVVRVVTNDDKDHFVDRFAVDIGLRNPDAGTGSRSTSERFGCGDGPCGESLAPGIGGRTALTIRVQTGCEERCSYCIIPQTRGAGRSQPLSSVLQRIREAVEVGYREIAITGVHLGSYGRDLGDGSSLATLIEQLARWEDDVLFRISSLEPMDCTDAIVDLMAESRRLAPHFHLPLQHGADEMLQAMRRPYTASAYQRLVDRIRASIPDASIGSDVIVGFPGETERHFETMCEFLRPLPLTHLHVFPYSDRPGTDATTMANKVEGTTIRDRGRAVRVIGESMTRRFRQSQVGSVRRALTVDGGWSAVTDNYLKVQLERQHPRNEWVMTRIPEI